MAKSFKQPLSLGLGIPTKPLSEQDFFDLTEEPALPVRLEKVSASGLELRPDSSPGLDAEDAVVVAGQVPSRATDSSKVRVPETPTRTPCKRITRRTTGNTPLPDKPREISELVAPSVGDTQLAAEPLDTTAVRQTFVVGASHLEKLRDYVHDRRSRGDYQYSQRQALQEALDLLFAGSQAVAPRPAQQRERERQQRVRIRQGRRAGANRQEETPPAD